MLKIYLFCFVSALGFLINGTPLDSSSDFERFFAPRIVGGIDAPKAFAPYMAALIVGDEFKILNCGGSIVAPNLILTAAHCIDIFIMWGKLLPSFHGVVGSNNWSSGGLVVQFKDYHVHPGWDMSQMENDIGFLVLESSLQMSESVGVISLTFNRVGGGQMSYVTGWGRLEDAGVTPYKLQLLYKKTITPAQCIEGVRQASADLNQWVPSVNPSLEICTFHSVGHGMCNGDSGSALVEVQTGRQIGIVSWGFPCAIGAPDVFVRLSGHRGYVQGIMRRHHHACRK